MHISSLFYTARFKRLVADLKQQGVFREEPLRDLDKLVYLAFSPLVLANALALLKNGIVAWDLFLILVAMAISLSFFEIRYRINKLIIPCTTGQPEPIALEGGPFYGHIHLGMKAWIFFYYFEAPDKKSREIAGLRMPISHRSPLIPKKLFDKEKFLSEPKVAFVDPENPKNFCPYVEGLLKKYRMTTAPVFPDI